MVRTFLVITTFFLLAITAVSAQAQSLELRNDVSVQDSSLRLSDIFAGLPVSEDRVLGPAPRPGKDMTLNARTLRRIAVALDLPWRPISDGDFTIIRRAATIISRGEIEDAVMHELQAMETSLGPFEASIHNTEELVLPESVAATMEIVDIDYNPVGRSFTAKIVAPSKDNPIKTLRTSGRIYKITKVPVLRESMNNGTRITQNDIRLIPVREDRLGADMIVSAKALIGLTPKRLIKAGDPITAQELLTPHIVERGQAVTMIYSSGSLNLTSIGKALENGAKGDLVRVVNSASSQSVEGIVTGDQEITVKEF